MQSNEMDTLTMHSLALCLDIGGAMLSCGAEISRVENTIERLCRLYGAEYVEVFVIPSLIICSIRSKNGESFIQIRRIKRLSNDLFRLEALNSLSRKLCAEKPPLDSFKELLKDAMNVSFYPFLTRLIGAGIVCGSFALIFGGGVYEAIISSIIGVIVFISDKKSLFNINTVAKTAVLAFIGGSLSCLFGVLIPSLNIGSTAIGSAVLLLPGLAFGNALGNLLQGDVLSGVLGTVRAVLTAVMLALGYILAFGIFSVTSAPVIRVGGLLFRAITALVGVSAFAVIFDVSPAHLPSVAIGGLMTFLIYNGLLQGNSLFVSAFVTATIMRIYSEIMARVEKAPALIFSVPCSIPILPGVTLYKAMSALISGDNALAGRYFFGCMQVGGGIACGIALVAVIIGIAEEIRRLIKNKISAKK